MRKTLRPIRGPNPPRQLGMVLDSLELNGLSADERKAVISRLARLLMEVAGLKSGESGDDGR